MISAKASTFFSYSWNGTRLEDVLEALEHFAATNPSSAPRFVWLDMFCDFKTDDRCRGCLKIVWLQCAYIGLRP